METPRDNFFKQATLVTLGCLFGAIYSGYLLYRDVQNLGDRTGSPIAKLERLEAKVRMKAARSFVWGPAHVSQELYAKDSVQTAPNGGAAVKFNDGSVLEVGENSLVVIDQLSDLSLGLLRGSGVLRTKTGDSRITLDESGKAKVEVLPVRLINPDAFSELFSEKSTRTVQFSWSLSDSADSADSTPGSIRLEISSDRKFNSKNLKSISVAGSVTEASASLPAGRFFWRVVGTHLKTEPEQFRVDSVSSLQPLYPTAGQRIEAFGDSAPLEFNWSPEKEDSALEKFTHKIEISRSMDFSQLISSDSIAASSGVAHTKGLPSGTFYWRIVSGYKDSNQSLELKSAAEKFQIERIEKVDVSLGEPANKSELELLPRVKFSWSAASPGLNYHWEIREKGSEQIQAESQTKESQNLLLSSVHATLLPGVYEWHVKAALKDHIVGESPWRSISFYEGQKPILKNPLAQQEYRFWSEAPSFNLNWSADAKVQSGERSFLVEIANSGEFKSALQIEIKNPELASEKVHWTPGEQFWRVSVIDSKKRILKTSDVSQFYYGPYPLLRAPASVSPAPGTIYNPLTQEKPLIVHWDEVKEAQSYELTVKSGDQIILHKNTEKAEFEFKDLKPGKYHFTVSAIDRLQRKGEATPDREFEVTYGDTLDAPESLSPEVQ